MTKKPEIPKNFYRDYGIIILCSVISGGFFYWYEMDFLFRLVPLVIVTMVPPFYFRNYYAELSLYKRPKVNVQPSQQKPSKVNENIAKYIAMQKERKANAKWWQFWI
jgi:hypothetical protein